MIQITCTNCKALLQIDDAFAGGVCRCRHCGTIQTVPKHLKRGNGDAEVVNEVSMGGGSSAKTLYQKKTTIDAGSGTGLDDLAGIVASSGLSSRRLRSSEGSSKTAMAPAKDKKVLIIVCAAGGVIALLLGIIIFMAVKDKSGGGDGVVQNDNGTSVGGSSGNNTSVGPNIAAPKKRPPSFLGQPLNEKSVVYVLDHGQASLSEGRLELLKAALVTSLKSLGPDRKFAVMFWQMSTDNKDLWPKEGLRPATPENIADVQKMLDEVFPAGQTKVPAGLDKAFKSGAEAIVLVPIKTFLGDEVQTAVTKARGKTTAKVYCFSLGQPDLGEKLKKLAGETSGAYRDVSMGDLREAGTE